MKTTLILLLFCIIARGQKIGEYGKLDSGKNVYSVYISKNGHAIKVGDTMLIGSPSSNNGFNHITQGGQKAAVFLSDRKVVIWRIRTYKDKRFEKRAYLQFKGYGLLPVDVDYELAVKTGELESVGD